MSGLTTLVFMSVLQALALAAPDSAVPMLFMFGDSILDAGNNIYLPGSMAVANVTPYGSTSFGTPTGRFSDGRLVADFIAEFLGFPYIPPFLKPGASFLHGANFASAGSGILNTTDANLKVISFTTQVDHFQSMAEMLRENTGDYQASQALSKSLYLVSAGSNDIYANLFQAAANRRRFLFTLMGIYRRNILELYRSGARKFVIFNLGPLGCTPMVRRILRGGCFNLINDIANSFNLVLRLLLRDLGRLPGARFAYAKGFSSITDIMSNSSAYGIHDVSHACCGVCGGLLATREPQGVCDNPNRFLFWDFTHPTESTYSILAKNFWEGSWNYIEPWNIKTLAGM